MTFGTAVRVVLNHETGGHCSNPDCRAITGMFMPGKAISTGDAAHIVAEKRGGARGNLDLTDEERAQASNGIWLCANCHRTVDVLHPNLYSVEILRAWKAQARGWWQANQGRPLQLAAAPNAGAQVLRPRPEATMAARKFLQLHLPLIDSLSQIQRQSPTIYHSDFLIPNTVEVLIAHLSTPRGIGRSWRDEWSTTYHCDDQLLSLHMLELIRRVDCLQRPSGQYNDRYINLARHDPLVDSIRNYIDAWSVFRDCLIKAEGWGLT